MTAPTTHTGGGICPLCTWAQDNNHPHPCITDPTSAAIVTILEAGHALPSTVIDQLTVHPARPLADGNLRPVHRTWCFCACSPDPATPRPGAARS